MFYGALNKSDYDYDYDYDQARNVEHLTLT